MLVWERLICFANNSSDWTYLGCQAREVVCRFECASDALFDVCITTVVSTQDGVLESTRVLQLKSELAILALLRDRNTRTNGGDIGVVNQGHNTLVIGDDSANSALRTPCAACANLEDFHLDQSVTVIFPMLRMTNTWPGRGASSAW